jgi:hypothetical protein
MFIFFKTEKIMNRFSEEPRLIERYAMSFTPQVKNRLALITAISE